MKKTCQYRGDFCKDLTSAAPGEGCAAGGDAFSSGAGRRGGTLTLLSRTTGRANLSHKNMGKAKNPKAARGGGGGFGAGRSEGSPGCLIQTVPNATRPRAPDISISLPLGAAPVTGEVGKRQGESWVMPLLPEDTRWELSLVSCSSNSC